MAYTREWAQVMNLLGSRDADEIDDASREAKVDLDERFRDVIQDVDAFPWKLKIPGVDVNQKLWMDIHPVSGYGVGGVTLGAVSANPSRYVFLTPAFINGQWYVPVNLPRGSIVTDVVLHVRQGSGTAIQGWFAQIDHVAGRTDIASGSVPIIVVGNYSMTLVGGFPYTIVSGFSYLLECYMTSTTDGNEARFYGATIGYKPPGAA